MKRLSNKSLLIVTIIALVVSVCIISLSYTYMEGKGNNVELLKNDNNIIKGKIEEKNANIEILNEKNKSLSDKISKVKDLEKKLSTNSNDLDLASLIKLYDDSRISDINVNMSNMRIEYLENEPKDKKTIKTIYYNGDPAPEESYYGNLIIGSFLFADSYYTDISENIVEDNNRINKYIGTFKYLDKTENFYIKYLLYNNLEQKGLLKNNIDLSLSDFSKDLILLKKYYMGLYSLSNYTELLTKGSMGSNSSTLGMEIKKFSLDENLKLDKDIYKKILDNYLFLIDTYSENANYISDIDIFTSPYEDGKNLKFMADSDKKIFLIEEISSDGKSCLYFYDSLQKPLYKIDLNTIEEEYIQNNSNNKDYQKSSKLLEVCTRSLKEKAIASEARD